MDSMDPYSGISETVVKTLGVYSLDDSAFISEDGLVIGYKGHNYYKACGVIVTGTALASTSCVKRKYHGGDDHEDYAGMLRPVTASVIREPLETPLPEVTHENTQ